MAYTQQPDGTIVINGFENGVSEDPYNGISDMRNVNIISIPKEASVNFKTQLVTSTVSSGTITTTSAGNDTITTAANLDTRECIRFSALSDTTKGIALNTDYWVVFTGGTEWNLYTTPALTSLVNITADSITGTFSVYKVNRPKNFVKDNNDTYWTIDSLGQVWTNALTTTTNNYWVYTGNSGGSGGWDNPNIAFYSASDGTGYIFAFRNNYIDYTKAANTQIAWTYGWKTLKTAAGVGNSHDNILAPDNVVYFCDSRYIGRFYQTDLVTPTPFDPSNSATYTFDETPLLPSNDIAQSIAFLGTSVMIGGQRNVIYPWDTTSPTFSYPLFIAESFISKMVTINTNTFIFAGNRGRIYVTNGSQAQLYKKLPDHISGTVEPYFQWGGAATIKNQLYFSASCTTNGGTPITAYGGVWAIDVDTKALRLTNKLSYGTYAGYASAIIPIIPTLNITNPGGAGLYIGWDSGASTYGIDQTISSLYTSGEAYVDSDLIPIGTVLKPTTNSYVEFKLAMPLVSGESVKIQYRQKFSDSFADITTSAGTTTFNTVGIYSGVYQGINFQNSQWVQFRAILTSTNSSPSYVRLTELRVK